MYTARICGRGIQCTEQCTERCIYTREIIAIGGALASSRYIDLPSSLPNTQDFLLRRAAAAGRQTPSMISSTPCASLIHVVVFSVHRSIFHHDYIFHGFDRRFACFRGENGEREKNLGKYSRNSSRFPLSSSSSRGRWIVEAFVTEETIILGADARRVEPLVDVNYYPSFSSPVLSSSLG